MLPETPPLKMPSSNRGSVRPMENASLKLSWDALAADAKRTSASAKKMIKLIWYRRNFEEILDILMKRIKQERFLR